MLSPGASDCCGSDWKINAVCVGIDALKRHAPVTFVPTFFMVNFTAGRLPLGTVALATKDSADVVARYPTAVMLVVRSGRPNGADDGAVEPSGIVSDDAVPAVTGTFFVGGTVFVVLEAAVLEPVVPNEMVVEASDAEVEREDDATVSDGLGAGLNTEPSDTAAAPIPPTTDGTNWVA